MRVKGLNVYEWSQLDLKHPWAKSVGRYRKTSLQQKGARKMDVSLTIKLHDALSYRPLLVLAEFQRPGDPHPGKALSQCQ